MISTAAVDETFLPGLARVSGWGRLEEAGVFPDQLTAATVPLVPRADCRAAYGQLAVADSMLCAGGGAEDACEGDAGGPLVCTGPGDQEPSLKCFIKLWENG